MRKMRVFPTKRHKDEKNEEKYTIESVRHVWVFTMTLLIKTVQLLLS